MLKIKVFVDCFYKANKRKNNEKKDIERERDREEEKQPADDKLKCIKSNSIVEEAEGKGKTHDWTVYGLNNSTRWWAKRIKLCYFPVAWPRNSRHFWDYFTYD